MEYENLVPALLANQIKENVLSYLKTTFNIKNEGFAQGLENHLRSEAGIFKGPFVDIKLPFKSSSGSKSNSLDINLKFKPFDHQSNAFNRLSSKLKLPQNTIVATGTGSGKTESFLIPLLDHCIRANRANKTGIKAIILYPMNALAFDQSRRIAELIFDYPELNEKVTAGILVGEDRDGEKRKTAKVMTAPDHIIDDRAALIKNPPDILLTNYKMLDALLMKPEFDNLWKDNPPVQYLVLDEMHSYDGAQGADVAFLIRRLKAKIGIEPNTLCCIGTSATLLSGIEGTEILTRFATRLFGEGFDKDSIIGETRESIDEAFKAVKSDVEDVPADSKDLDFNSSDSLTSYVGRLAKLWFNVSNFNSLELGRLVLSHKLTRTLFVVLKGKPTDETIVLLELKNHGFSITQRQMYSFLSLIAHSQKEIEIGSHKTNVALFQVRVQLWLREMRRTLASLQFNSPKFRWLDEQTTKIENRYLPPVFCEECGEVGYLASVNNKNHEFEWDVQKLYEHYLEGDSSVRYLFPWGELDRDQTNLSDAATHEQARICHSCGYSSYEEKDKYSNECTSCHSEWDSFRVWSCLSKEHKRDKRQCPSCDTRNSLRLLASRTTTLSSIVNSQLFLTKLNPKNSKKLLVFADTVQDASHRAGYYNARTYRFNFRTAVQSFLSSTKENFRLLDFQKPFLDFYLKSLGDDKVVATFSPSDFSNLKQYEDFFSKQDRKSIIELLKSRVTWELYLEYSLKSQVGRTLEKTLSSAAYVDYADEFERINSLYDELANEHEFLRQAGLSKFREFILGLVERALLRGAIAFDFLESYRLKESAWELDKKKMPWISRMPKGRLDGSEVGSLPKFISTNPNAKIFDYMGAPEQGDSWYSFWLKKCFKSKDVVIFSDSILPFYSSVLSKLSNTSLFSVKSHEKTGYKNYGLNPDKISITKDIDQLTCRVCAHKIVVPGFQKNDYNGLGCIITRCKGVYELNDKLKEKNYYQSIYQSGDIERIFAHEHTGLLSRKDREELEIEFKEKDPVKRRADSVNLLSCTPTLEMGIDVGDLSATVVGALPPSAANYQQQVGRAGRKSGSALIVAVAQSKPRDLLYFRYPEELIAGHIEPPGCFVDAPDLLKRQFFAFTFDQCFSDITHEVGKLKVEVLKDEVRQVRVGGILTNIKTLLAYKSDELFKSFKGNFRSDDISENTWKEVQAEFSKNSSGQIPFVIRLQQVIERFVQEGTLIDIAKSELNSKLQIFERLNESGASLDDEQKAELRELKYETAALEAQKELLGARAGFFEFLTHYSFLPNYAFQEDAIELVGLILDEEKDAKGRFSIKHRESFERPAKIGLRELAPLNTFYGGGYKMQIEQIDVGGKVKTLIEEWKFCSCCGFFARKSTEGFDSRICPNCGDGQWNDIDSKMMMLKFQKAVSLETTYSSQVGDDAEDRQKKFFKVRPFFEIPKGAVRQSWGCSDEKFVFGLEFIQRMTMREVNFGADSKIQKEKIEIVGESLPRGFLICHSCGRVAKPEFGAHGEEKIKHQASCVHAKVSKTPEQRKMNPKDKPVMLYRELQSEAIRVLLPVSEYDADVRLSSIKAAIMFGFIKKFGGKPIHLEISHQRAIETGEEKMSKRYLVIFDAVPGGTGFLRELWDKDSFFDLIKKSLEAMESCLCDSSEDLDGCPRCILSAASQFEIQNISRKEAIKYLKLILENKDKLKELKQGIESIDTYSFLDSELEYRFLGILKRLKSSEISKRLNGHDIEVISVTPGKKDEDPIEIELKNVKTFKNYKYRISNQKPLNEGSLYTIADFYIENLEDENSKNMAVYLDGFKYHAGPVSGDRLNSDMKKRQALINGDGVNRHKVWTLTWKDLEAFEGEPSDHIAKYLFKLNLPAGHFFGMNSVIQLFMLLTGQVINFEEFLKIWQGTGFERKMVEKGFMQKFNELSASSSIKQNLSGLISSSVLGKSEVVIYQNTEPIEFGLAVVQQPPQKASLISFDNPILIRSDSTFHDNWERLLDTLNLSQLITDSVYIDVKT